MFKRDEWVYWTDPDAGALSGLYKVTEVRPAGEDTILFIENASGSEAEVFARECTPGRDDVCPVCGGEHPEGDSFDFVDGDTVFQAMGCPDCNSTWQNRYTFAGPESIFDGREPEPGACPFCGERDRHYLAGKAGAMRVRCLACHAEGPSAEDREGAVALWNNRRRA